MHLRENGRKKLTEISSKTNIPVSTVFDMLHRFEKQELIQHKTHIDFGKLGYEIRVMIALETSREGNEQLQKFLQQHRNVNSVFSLQPDCRFMVEAVFKNHDDYGVFLSTLQNQHDIVQKNVYQIGKVIQDEQFLKDLDHYDIGK
jgi:DNA-binding Lrp family transcriptional regulator